VGYPEGRNQLEGPGVDENIKMDLQEVGWGTWNGLIWFRIRTSPGLL
jgi:hypothetical protein